MTAHVEERLSAYLDDELPAPERSAVDEHLGACAECARRLAQLATVDDAARALPVEAPAGYFEAFPERLRLRLDPPKRATWRLPAWSWAVAATLFLVVVTPALLPRAARAPARETELPVASRPLARKPADQAAAPPATLPAAKNAALKTLGYAKGDDKAFRAPAEQARTLAPPSEADASKESGLAQGPAAAGRVPEAPAPPGAFAPEPQRPLAAAEAEQRGERDMADRKRALEGKQEEGPGRRAARSSTLGAPATVPGKTPPAEAHYARLLARGAAGSPAEALATREAWRGFARDHPSDSRADEARVRAIEAGAALYRLSKELRDLESVRQDAASYLKRDDALLGERVRAVLHDLER